MTNTWLKRALMAAVLASPVAQINATESTTLIRPFSEYGIVDAGLQEGKLVISDTTYHVSDQTQVHKAGGKSATLGELRQGVKVGFNMYGTRAERYLSDIWILPANTDLNAFADD